MSAIETQTIGFPRIGADRELKRALEAHWRGKQSAEELLETFKAVQRERLQLQQAAGIQRIGVGDATLYDHVLDWSRRLGLVPERFLGYQGLEQYFAMARGAAGQPALELTKWYDTNYHYLVPEVDQGPAQAADFADFFEQLELAREVVGDRAVPIVLGPITLLSLAKRSGELEAAVGAVLPLYHELLEELDRQGYREVQLHEPRLVQDGAAELEPLYRRALDRLANAGPALNLVTFFDDLGQTYPWVVELPIAALSLDFTRGDSLSLVQQYGFPADKQLAVGLVDGRNVWRIRPKQAQAVIEQLGDQLQLRIGPSSSLQFVPYSADREQHLPAPLQGVLAFAEQKLAEVAALGGADGSAERMAQTERAWQAFAEFSVGEPEVREQVDQLRGNSFARSTPYEQRRSKQVKLPNFPLTTIGSFPQTSEVRKLRAAYKRGEIDQQQYQSGIDAWIAYTIGAQEGLGMDVLVHGEFERSDMVEFFAEKMNGFAFTEHGWVQSYGNRYVRPPIIWGDVRRTAPMTVREFAKAQSFTEKPVKGMLTGPVTILNWSFVRDDIPREQVAYQLALALREEIADLEAAGAKVIQVDEPALREGLPLKRAGWEEYLRWAVDAFRLATGGAQDQTQVQTHMCYAEFGDIFPAIDRLNADVILIENARSGDETIHELADYGYRREVGPGVYDVHSSNIPPVERVKARLQAFAAVLQPEQIWVNPDCGLKTRRWDEVLPALSNVAEAVRQMREENGS